jgi:hypothetical protein
MTKTYVELSSGSTEAMNVSNESNLKQTEQNIIVESNKSKGFTVTEMPKKRTIKQTIKVLSDFTEKKRKSLRRKLRESISTNEEIPEEVPLSFETIEEAENVLIAVKDNLDYYIKKTFITAIQMGGHLNKLKDLYDGDMKIMMRNIQNWGLNISKSYVYLLIQLYIFSKKFPKIKNLTMPIREFKNNFSKIRLVIDSKKERNYWKD